MGLASRRFPAECPPRTSNEGAPKDTSTNGSREYGRPMNFPPPYGDMHGAGVIRTWVSTDRMDGLISCAACALSRAEKENTAKCSC